MDCRRVSSPTRRAKRRRGAGRYARRPRYRLENIGSAPWTILFTRRRSSRSASRPRTTGCRSPASSRSRSADHRQAAAALTDDQVLMRRAGCRAPSIAGRHIRTGAPDGLWTPPDRSESGCAKTGGVEVGARVVRPWTVQLPATVASPACRRLHGLPENSRQRARELRFVAVKNHRDQHEGSAVPGRGR